MDGWEAERRKQPTPSGTTNQPRGARRVQACRPSPPRSCLRQWGRRHGSLAPATTPTKGRAADKRGRITWILSTWQRWSPAGDCSHIRVHVSSWHAPILHLSRLHSAAYERPIYFGGVLTLQHARSAGVGAGDCSAGGRAGGGLFQAVEEQLGTVAMPDAVPVAVAIAIAVVVAIAVATAVAVVRRHRCWPQGWRQCRRHRYTSPGKR